MKIEFMGNIEPNKIYLQLDNLFNLFLDYEFQEEDRELFSELNISIDPIMQSTLLLIKQLNVEAKAELNSLKFNHIKEFIKKISTNLELKSKFTKNMTNWIFDNPKYAELQPMFSNLQEITENDKDSILFDTKILELLCDIENNFNEELND